MDKDKIQQIADELAESMYGKDFYDLSGRQQSEVYEKAIVELNDMLPIPCFYPITRLWLNL